MEVNINDKQSHGYWLLTTECLLGQYALSVLVMMTQMDSATCMLPRKKLRLRRLSPYPDKSLPRQAPRQYKARAREGACLMLSLGPALILTTYTVDRESQWRCVGVL